MSESQRFSGWGDGDPLDNAQRFVETIRAISAESFFPGSIRNRIDAVVGRLTKKEAVLAFGGHFKAGKSATLNAALGRDLLPSAQFPETGVICALRRGEEDTAIICQDGSRVATACTTEAIRAVCSLVDEEAGSRRDLRGVERIELRLRGAPISDTAVWLDSPGVNDDAFADERAWKAAQEADVLVWIVWHEHPLSECEVSFLQRHLNAKGAGSLVFVLNCFMPEDTDEMWQIFGARQVPRIWKKVEECFADNSFDAKAPLTMFPISARAILRVDRERFGGSHLAKLLQEVDSPLHPRVWKSRLHGVAQELKQAAEEVNGQLQSVIGENSRRSELLRELEERAQRLSGQLRISLRNHIQRFVIAWSSIAGEVARNYSATEVTSLKLVNMKGPISHGERLSKRIRDGGQAVFKALCADVENELRMGGISDAEDPVIAPLEKLLDLDIASQVTPAKLPSVVEKNLMKVGGASVVAGLIFHPLVIAGGVAVAVVANQQVDRIRREVNSVAEWLPITVGTLVKPIVDAMVEKCSVPSPASEIPSPDSCSERVLSCTLNDLDEAAAMAEKLAAEIAV